MRLFLTLFFLVLIGFTLVVTVAEMPTFGDPNNPTNNEVAGRFIEQGVEETGAVNLIASILLDYRAFDTLGEATVLFVAIAASLSCLKAHGGNGKGH